MKKLRLYSGLSKVDFSPMLAFIHHRCFKEYPYVPGLNRKDVLSEVVESIHEDIKSIADIAHNGASDSIKRQALSVLMEIGDYLINSNHTIRQNLELHSAKKASWLARWSI